MGVSHCNAALATIITVVSTDNFISLSIMVFSVYAKQRAIFLHEQGMKASTIGKLLQAEGIKTTCVAVHYFLKQYKASGTI